MRVRELELDCDSDWGNRRAGSFEEIGSGAARVEGDAGGDTCEFHVGLHCRFVDLRMGSNGKNPRRLGGGASCGGR